jgi:multicomponent Na+:H+ antiporter subunit C
MITPFDIYAVGAAALVALGFHGVLTRRHLVRQILALNVMGGGVFLFLIAVAYRNADPEPDPLPHALVLTGIVVAVSVSAFALALARTVHARLGRTWLHEEDLE